jgi:hypothetical protein
MTVAMHFSFEEHTRSLEDDRHVASAQQSLPETTTTSSSKLQQPPHPNYNNLLVQTTTPRSKQPPPRSNNHLYNLLASAETASHLYHRTRATSPAVRGQEKGWERSSEWEAETYDGLVRIEST